MKAAVRYRYGPPEVLSVTDVEIPKPKDNEVLVQVRATTVNRTDYHVLTGKPFIMKFFTGLRKPKLPITGSDFAGVVQALGQKVTRFSVGDRVMGFIDTGAQSHAQYLTLAENLVAFAPSNVNYAQAVACLEGAFYALSAIQRLDLQREQSALVIGGTGAIGSSYVQFLKLHDVEVTAVCRQEHDSLLRSLGATRIIDYRTEDFKKDDRRYHFVLDAVGKSTFGECRHLLKKKGIYISSEPNLFQALITPITGGKREIFAIPRNLMDNLQSIKNLVEQGNFVPVIDRQYPLEQIREAYAYVASGEKIGNVIVDMDA